MGHLDSRKQSRLQMRSMSHGVGTCRQLIGPLAYNYAIATHQEHSEYSMNVRCAGSLTLLLQARA